MGQTPFTYYENEDLHGDYQYVSLKDILNGMLLEMEGDDGHTLKGLSRSLLIRYAKTAIREIHKDAANEVKGFSITVPDNLTWPLPQDFVKFVRISVNLRDKVTGSYRLHKLDINRDMNMYPDYLQDNSANLLFDEEGDILQADGINAMGTPYKRYKFCQNADSYKLSQWGEFNYNTREMCFSSDLADKEVVVEYISDGLSDELADSEVHVHKYLRRVIENYIYYLAIERKREISGAEKQRANLAYKTSLHKAKMTMADFDLNQIAKAVRGGNVMP